MQFLITPFLVYIGISVSLLFWWRPAPELLFVKSVDWALEYENQHTPGKHMWGAMEIAREFIRAGTSHQPLTEFIEKKTRDQLTRVDDDMWRELYDTHFAKRLISPGSHAYFSPESPPMDVLKQSQGYVELRLKNAIRFLYYNRLDALDMDRQDIPTRLKYPLRGAAITLVLASLVLWGSKRFRPREENRAAQSTAGTGCRVSLAILTMGMTLGALPFFYYNGQGGFAAFFFGILMCLTGMVGLAFFGVQVVAVHKMVSGKDCLAHWTYAPLEWDRFAKWEMSAASEARWGLLAFISLIIVGVGLGFWLFMQDTASLWVFVFLLGLIVCLWGVALLAQILGNKRLRQSPGEVFLGSSGIYINGAVHTWNLIGSRFESASKIEKPLPMLEIVYSYLMVAGRSLYFFRQYATVRVPIPEGKAAEATAIVKHYCTVKA